MPFFKQGNYKNPIYAFSERDWLDFWPVLTFLPKIIVDFSFIFHFTFWKSSAIRKDEIIVLIAIKVTHQAADVPFVVLADHRLAGQKSYPHADPDCDSYFLRKTNAN